MNILEECARAESPAMLPNASDIPLGLPPERQETLHLRRNE